MIPKRREILRKLYSDICLAIIIKATPINVLKINNKGMLLLVLIVEKLFHFRRLTRRGREVRKSPLPFFKNLKNVSQFWVKMPWLWPSMGYISHAVLRASRRKNPKFNPAEPFFYALYR